MLCPDRWVEKIHTLSRFLIENGSVTAPRQHLIDRRERADKGRMIFRQEKRKANAVH